MALRIGELARVTRTNPPTIRYYEEIGLLPPADRREGGQRYYGEEDRQRLTFIRQCREFGFPIAQVRSLVELTEDGGKSCMEARTVAADHLASVKEKLGELRKLERNLTEYIAWCDAACSGGPGPDCVILKGMAKSASENASPRPGRRRR